MKNEKIKLPFMSIVVCAYNAEDKISETISSLLTQNYPKNRYEIIVVDDSSSDSTAKLINKFPVKLIKHKKNRGLATARNTGLRYAKGEVYVCFDDDCIADKIWLKNLSLVYQKNKNILGACGILHGQNDDNLFTKYLSLANLGNPTDKNYLGKSSLVKRLFIYLFNNNNHIRKKCMYSVGHIHGANSSFCISNLKKIKGWDPKFRLGQDTEICERLSLNFPNKEFICNPAAKIFHDHPRSFLKYLSKLFFKGKHVLAFYTKYKKTLPIFPFPLITIFLSLLLALINMSFGIVGIILIPQILYFWWPIKFIKKLEPCYLIFPYIQLSLESSTLAGLIRGLIIRKFEK